MGKGRRGTRERMKGRGCRQMMGVWVGRDKRREREGKAEKRIVKRQRKGRKGRSEGKRREDRKESKEEEGRRKVEMRIGKL